MSRLGLAIVAGGTALLTLHGCGIDVVGFADPLASDGAAPEAASGPVLTDGAGRTDGPPSVDGTVTACSCPAAPAGFTLVAYAANRDATCAGDLETVDVVTNPVAGPAACTCGTCNVTTLPTCTAPVEWRSMKDDESVARCNVPGSNTFSTTGCDEGNGNLASHSRVPAPTPSGGTCAASVVENSAAVTATPARVCRPAGQTCACDPALDGKFKTCLWAKGAVDCPAEAPNRALAAGKTELACPDCTCTLTRSCRASVTWYGSDGCNNPIATIDSDECRAQPPEQYRSSRYSLEAKATCTADPAPTGTATLIEPDTICCP